MKMHFYTRSSLLQFLYRLQVDTHPKSADSSRARPSASSTSAVDCFMSLQAPVAATARTWLAQLYKRAYFNNFKVEEQLPGERRCPAWHVAPHNRCLRPEARGGT
jgi:hypothetical protein